MSQVLKAVPNELLRTQNRYMNAFSVVALFMVIGQKPDPTWLSPYSMNQAAWVRAVVGDARLAEFGTVMYELVPLNS